MTRHKMSYTKLGIISALIFLIIIIIFDFLIALTSKEAIESIIANIFTTKYLLKKIIFAVFYGVFMVFLIKRKKNVNK